MLEKTPAICLKSFHYKESSTIATLFTLDNGLQTCIVKGGRKKSSGVKSSYFQPLQPLEVVLYNSKKSNIHTIKECSIGCDITNATTDIVRTSLVFFISEVIGLSLKEENPSEEMFEFFMYVINTINDTGDTKELKDFHLYFLYHFARLLGFSPMDNYDKNKAYFDLNKGEFVALQDTQTLDKHTSLLFHDYINAVQDTYSYFTSNSQDRNVLLGAFIYFFETHITLKQIKSQTILRTIL